MELNDWSTHLMKAERALKSLNDSLLHKRYDEVLPLIDDVWSAMDDTRSWLAVHERSGDMDVLPLLRNMKGGYYDAEACAAIREIEHLRKERAALSDMLKSK